MTDWFYFKPKSDNETQICRCVFMNHVFEIQKSLTTKYKYLFINDVVTSFSSSESVEELNR
jgi:hypothetical protein